MDEFTQQLLVQATAAAADDPDAKVALLGCTPTSLTLRRELNSLGMRERLVGIFDPRCERESDVASAWAALHESGAGILVVCANAEKRRLLLAAADALRGVDPPVVVLAGTAHLEFQDDSYEFLDAPALVPSYATGYAYTRVHLFQCLQAAAANGLRGAIVEFGSFKGGTTAWLARVARQLGLDCPVIAFDSWAGFPPRRSLLDLYAHPRCVFSDLDAVRAYLEPLGVELVAGDIFETAPRRLSDEPVLLAFVDTDNYSPAASALRAVLPNLVIGGAIVFDHFFTTSEYVYTLGERMAADEVLKDSKLLHLHGTGVFVRIK